MTHVTHVTHRPHVADAQRVHGRPQQRNFQADQQGGAAHDIREHLRVELHADAAQLQGKGSEERTREESDVEE